MSFTLQINLLHKEYVYLSSEGYTPVTNTPQPDAGQSLSF